jgi:2-oxoisovalerate dehydrogenase E2 component (dihydrolipoyl transacylase)
MGLYAIRMPDIGEGIAEVELVAWRVQAGETVLEDQVLADVMTDKATVEIPSPVAGTVVALGAAPGALMAVGSELIRLEVDGEGNVKAGAEARVDVTATASAHRSVTRGDESAAAATPATRGMDDQLPSRVPDAGGARPEPSGSTAPAIAPVRAPGERPIASPAVRRRAWELGVELRFVRGSGPAGRISHEDLDAHVRTGGLPAAGVAQTARERHGQDLVPVIGLRRRIAQKMQEAKRRIPHFSYVEEVDVTELEALRFRLNTRYGPVRGKLTLLPLIARAVVLAVDEFPQMNARFDDEAGMVTRYRPVHLGIATQTGGGLMVPVLRHAEAQDVWGISREVARLAEAARSGRAGREELTGSTLTVTSLGALGGLVTTPVINHPEVAIVGVNRMVERPVWRDGTVVPRQMMNLSSSFDHRVVDGMDAARFVQAIRALLEHPAMLFVE